MYTPLPLDATPKSPGSRCEPYISTPQRGLAPLSISSFDLSKITTIATTLCPDNHRNETPSFSRVYFVPYPQPRSLEFGFRFRTRLGTFFFFSLDVVRIIKRRILNSTAIEQNDIRFSICSSVSFLHKLTVVNNFRIYHLRRLLSIDASPRYAARADLKVDTFLTYR